MNTDDYYKELMDQQFGKRRGGLWRSERDWYVFADKNPMAKLHECADYVKHRSDALYNEKGFSRSRNHRWIGSIPMEVAIANPELMYDPEAAKRFFKDNPKFSSKQRV